MTKTQSNISNGRLLFVSLLLYIICYLLLTNAFLFWEVSWHIEGAKRMLNGGSYLTNLFDDNSPAVFAFYIPFAWLSKVISIAQYKLAFLYILVIFGISNYFTLKILKKRLRNNYSIYTLHFTSIIISLFFAITILGERENIIVCLSLPYIFMNLLNKYEDDAKQTCSSGLQIIIAFLAAISILQVPFYLLLPLSIDIIDCVANKRKPQIYQTLFYLFFIVGFTLSYLLYPAYYDFLLKLLYHFQTGFDNTYTALISNDFFKYIIYILILITFFTLYFYRKLIYLKLIFLVLATLLIYTLEKKVWFYHFYPILCYTFLSFMFIHLDNKFLAHKKIERLLKHFLMICYALPLLVIIASIYANYYGHLRRYHNKNTTISKLLAFSKSTNPDNNKTLFFFYSCLSCLSTNTVRKPKRYITLGK